jgi:hypothetical protein
MYQLPVVAYPASEICDSSIFVTFYNTEWHERAVIRPEPSSPEPPALAPLMGAVETASMASCGLHRQN